MPWPSATRRGHGSDYLRVEARAASDAGGTRVLTVLADLAASRATIDSHVFLFRHLWALPATLLGLPFAALAIAGGGIRVVDGVIEAHGPWLRWALSHCLPLRGVTAMTLGHVVIGCDAASLDVSRAHERVHVRQYERWGAFFLPAYLLASVWAMSTGRHYYRDNVFEREAYSTTGALRHATDRDKASSGGASWLDSRDPANNTAPR